MIRLGGAVGKGGMNRPHDVAVIQAALLKLPAQSSAKRPYSGAIDGRASPALDAAIGVFQASAGLSQSMRIEPQGSGVQALGRLLPMEWRGLSGLEGCRVVIVSQPGSASASLEQAARVMRERTLLPMKVAAGLETLVRDVYRKFGLVLRPQGHGVDPLGHLVQGLSFAEVRWLDSSGRATTAPPVSEMSAILAPIRRVKPSGPLEWLTGSAPSLSAPPVRSQQIGAAILQPGFSIAPGSVLAVRSREPLRALAGSAPPVDLPRLKRLNLKPTGDPVADRMLDRVADHLEMSHGKN